MGGHENEVYRKFMNIMKDDQENVELEYFDAIPHVIGSLWVDNQSRVVIDLEHVRQVV